MLKRIIKVIYLVIPSIVLVESALIENVLIESALADWQITDQKTQELFSQDNDGNRFSLVQSDKDVDFVLVLSSPAAGASPNQIRIIIDSSQPLITDLQYIRQPDASANLTLVLDAQQKNQLMRQMIGGLELRLTVRENNKKIASLNYSLMGFTANLNDFLIAREIGRLDYQWLAEHNKHKELVCYYAANIYVQALLNRKENLTIENSLKNLPKTGMPQLDEEIGPEIIRNVYKLPRNKIPIEPRGNKYAMFTNCMSQ